MKTKAPQRYAPTQSYIGIESTVGRMRIVTRQLTTKNYQERGEKGLFNVADSICRPGASRGIQMFHVKGEK